MPAYSRFRSNEAVTFVKIAMQLQQQSTCAAHVNGELIFIYNGINVTWREIVLAFE